MSEPDRTGEAAPEAGSAGEADRLRSYFDASPVATLIVAPDLTILDVNAPHTELTGLARSEVVGRPLFDAFPKNPGMDGPDIEAVLRDSVERVRRTGLPDEPPVQRHDLPRPDGGFESHYWRMILSPVRQGGEIVAIRQDVWDVSLEARATQAAEIQRRSASALGEIAYWELDMSTDSFTYSDRLEAMFGIETGTAGDTPEAFRRAMTPESREAMRALSLSRLEGPLHEPAQAEVEVRLPSGEIRHMTARSEGALGEGGRRVVIGTIIDVTQLRRHERDLEAALDAKAALLVEVNHRVKNSLQLVASILSIGARAESEPRVRERLTSAAERVRAVASVHAQLYREDDVRRVDLGAQLPAFCAQLAERLGHEARGISLELDMDRVKVPTETAVAVSLIVNELVTNAFKHAFDDAALPPSPTVTVSLKEPVGGKLLLSVADNGTSGTNPEGGELPQEPIVGTGRGTGLGMRLITSLAAQLGAELDHENVEGRRTTLTFPV